jgi:branched-chain amino acid transport system substrate-binding protein
VDSEQYKVATSFVERYTAEYGMAPDHYAGHAYDGVHIVAEALKRLDEGFTAQELRDSIEKTSNLPGIGGVFNYSATDHNGMTKNDIVRYRAEGGKWVLDK